MSQEQLHTIEMSIEQAKSKIADLEALNRLSKNLDFQRIIDTGYFRDKAADIVMVKAMAEMQDEDKQVSCLKTIDAIGELRQYFIAITQIGNMARRELDGNEVTREELLAEDLKEAS